MVFPQITAVWLALLALLFAGLSLCVVALRAKGDVPFGDGGDDTLFRAIRAHGNFAEWVPLAALLVALLEMHGAAPALVHVFMGALFAARIAHPVAFTQPVTSMVYFLGRIFGALTTWAVVTGAAVLLLLRLL